MSAMSGSDAISYDSRGDQGLMVLHRRLEAHFRALRERRDEQVSGRPIFALEHGLSEPEVALMKMEVCSAVRRGRLPRDAWLPFVVYAAEMGYEYSGDEYWQTFEARTPSWAEHGDRNYIRRRFRDFRTAFGGAQPTGPWARQFSIICWPITHAVLPTDLQRQLARLLFDFRRGLTSDLLAQPDELGRSLAARAWHASSRFQQFAQNTDLLGQVAVALLVGDDDESPYLLDSTLRRIVADLSTEREAQRWLRDAKSSAFRVRTRGFRSREPATSESRGAGVTRLLSAADPTLFLRWETDGWAVHLELPDLSVLAERLPNVHDELGRLRARVAGVTGSPLARGWLLYPGQQVRLSQWPDRAARLIQLENGSDAVNNLLADQCVVSPGPRWLFRVQEPGLAKEVRGRFVRPGRQYVLLSEETLPALPWLVEAPCTASGVYAYGFEVPSRLSGEALTALRALDVTVVADVRIRPGGLVPASWDGEGTLEWLSGEDPIVAIGSTRAVSKCIVTLDAEPALMEWPEGIDEIFLRFSDLAPGTHQVDVSLLPHDDEEPVARGSLTFLIRSPHTRPSSGSFREGLMILANPANPTLTELWEGRAALDVVGPAGARATVAVSFFDRTGTPLATRRFPIDLPIDSTEWLNVFASQVRRAEEVQRKYDEAEKCVVEVSHVGVGVATLHCEREFAPLRWVFGRNSGGPFLRLISHADGMNLVVRRHEFAHPAEAQQVDYVPGREVRWPDGGLFVATAGTARVAAILPPLVRSLNELRSRSATPELPQPARTPDGVLKLIGLANDWAQASLPGDPFVLTFRLSVLRTIASRLAALIAGQRWARLEASGAEKDGGIATRELQAAVGDAAYQRSLAAKLDQSIGYWTLLEPEERVEDLAETLARYAGPAGVRGPDVRLAEFLLRLGSDPSSLATWPAEELRRYVDVALASPVLVRAARFAVLAIHASETEESDTGFRGWTWT
jgi:hypothetical protein